MVHIAVCLNAVTIHTFYININVAWIHIVPFAVKLDCVPVMCLAKRSFLTKHRSISIKDNLYKVGNSSRVFTPLIVAVFALHRITVAVQFIVQFFIRLPVRSRGDILTVFCVDLRMCTLKQISINSRVTETYRFLLYEYTYLIGSPHTYDGRSCRCSLLFTAAAVLLDINHVSCSLLFGNGLCLIFAINILQCIISTIIYLLFDHIVHAVICVCIQFILCRFRLYHFFHDIGHIELAVISQPCIEQQILLHICLGTFDCIQCLISCSSDIICIFLYGKLCAQII